MRTVLVDFEKRVSEIEEYFKMLDRIVMQNAKLYFPTKKTHRIKEIDEELIKVLKANTFLLLYNLMESSIKLSLTEVYDTITQNNMKYDDAIDKIRKIWLSENYKNFKGKATDFIFEAISNISNDVISIRFNSEKTISGNIDGRKIRGFGDMIGFSTTAHRNANNGEKLHQVKTQRNLLAHGTLSFTECGRQYTFDDLSAIKRQVIIYLRGILKNIEKYLLENAFSN